MGVISNPMINTSVKACTMACGHSSASLKSVAACSAANANATYANVHCAILCSLIRDQRVASQGGATASEGETVVGAIATGAGVPVSVRVGAPVGLSLNSCFL